MSKKNSHLDYYYVQVTGSGTRGSRVRFRPRAKFKNNKKKGYILSRDSEVTLSHWSRSIELVTMPLIDL
jgi:hypothetical protein